jgi:hypothetical protein
VENSRGEWVAADEMRPSLAQAVGYSMQQSSVALFMQTFDFGSSMTRERGQVGYGILPEQISSQSFRNYVQYVQGISGMPLQQAISYGYIKAARDVSANNLVGTAAAIPALSNIYGLQPERLVLTNSPNIPITIQRFSSRIVGANLQGDSSLMMYGLNPLWRPYPQSRSAEDALLRRIGQKK